MRTQFFPRLFFLCTMYFFVHASTFGNPRLKFDNFSTDEGLVSNFVNWVLTDSYGYLWIGTRDGVSRFDGINFSNYTQSSDTLGLNSNTITCIYEDWDSTLWFGTQTGLNIYDRELDLIRRFQVPGKSNLSEVPSIIQTSDSIVWFGTFSGLCRFNKVANTFQWITKKVGSSSSSLGKGLISSMEFDHSNQTLWVGTNWSGVFKVNVNTSEVVNIETLLRKPLASKNIRRLELGNNNELWVATMDAGIVVIDTLDKTSIVLNEKNSHLGNDYVYDLCLTKSGQMWASCSNGYLNLYKPSAHTFDWYIPDNEDPYSIRGVSISAMIEDKSGNIWVGSHGQGLSLANKNKQVFENFTFKNNDNRFLNSSIVTGFLEYSDQLWMSTDGGGINIYDRQTGQFSYFTKEDGLSTNWVLDMDIDSEGMIYAAFWQGGMCKIDPETLKVTYFLGIDDSPSGVLSYSSVKSVCVDDTIVWIGTHGQGINIYDRSNNVVITNENRNGEFFDLTIPWWINSIIKDSQNRVWFGSNQGLFMYDQNELLAFHEGDSGNTALISDHIKCVFEDSNKKIWLGTEVGLCVFDEQKVSFIPVIEQFGLPESALAITEDNGGRIWLSTNVGLYELDTVRKSSTHFTMGNGLSSDYFFVNSAYKLSDGKLAFGSIKGASVFYPDSINRISSEMPVALNTLLINNKVVSPGDGTGIISKVLSHIDTLFLVHDHEEVTIRFSQIAPDMTTMAKFAYRLVGFNDDWRFVGSMQQATYTNLDAGEYLFEVTTYDQASHLSSRVTKLNITVLPEWYEKLWVRIAGGFLGIGFLYLFFYLRIRSINKKNKLLEYMVKVRTEEIRRANIQLQEQYEEAQLHNELLEESNQEILAKNERITFQQKQIILQKDELEIKNESLESLNKKKDKFFSIIAHDLKNPVNALMGLTGLLHSRFDMYEPEKVKLFISHINTSTNSMYQLLINLLDWSRSESDSITPEPEFIDMTNLLEHIDELFSEQIRQKSIQFTYNFNPENTVFADRNMLETVIRNIVSNAIKFTPDGGNITVNSHAAADQTIVSISDSGVGIPPSKLDTLFDVGLGNSTKGTNNESGTGLGLLVCKEFVEKNGGTISVTSSDQGTIFYLKLPALSD